MVNILPTLIQYYKPIFACIITIEMLASMEDLGVETITKLLNDIYDIGQIPKDLSQSIFIAISKKPGAIECELHRTICLMSYVTKILLRIIMEGARNKSMPLK